MPRISRKSNPTGLVEIPRQKVTISETSGPGGPAFRLARLDVSGLNLNGDLRVACVVRAGRNARHFELGTLSSLDRSSHALDGLSQEVSPVYRILLTEPGNPQLKASAENLRGRQDGQGDSILPVRCVDLGDEIWKLQINAAGPALAVSSQIFSSPQETEGLPWLMPMVLPQALREILHRLRHTSEDWGQEWEAWLASELGRALPEPSEDDSDEFDAWVDDTVQHFCRRFRILTELRNHLDGGAHA